MAYIAAHIPDRTAYREQARAHFRAMFGDQRGWMELSTIEGDPDDRQRCRFHQSWFEYGPDKLDALIARIAELVKKHGNVYTSITLYSKPKRDKAYALPGRVVFIDDAQPGSYTYTLKTSDREQALIILDQLADVASREAIARRLSRAGADKSGWDITQLGRVPGTFNTKARAGGCYGRGPRDWIAGTGHRVTLIPRTLRTYTLAELNQRAPKASQAADEDGPAADLDWPEIERWRGNMAPLITPEGYPRRWKAHQQSYRVLSGDVVPVNDRGEADESTRRAFLARGCAWARYPHDAAAAILWHHTSSDYISRKGSEWHKGDIARVIAKEYAIVQQQVAGYQIRPITAAELKHGTQAAPSPIATVERKSRARRDRPQIFTPATLFAHYRTTPTICDQPRKPRAAALGISTATLDRLEKALRVLGLIEIERAGRGYSGRVILAGVINITSQGVLSGQNTKSAENPIENTQTADLDPQCIGETHPPRAVPLGPASAAPAPSLLQAVRLVFDRVHVDRETGEKRRITRKRLLSELAQLGSWPAAAVDRAIATERQRRRRLITERYLADLALNARNMGADQLKKRARSSAGAANAAQKRDDPRAWLKTAIAGIYAAEEARRQPVEPEPTTHELWAQVDKVAYQEARRSLRITPRGPVPIEPPAAGAGTSGGVCSPQPAPAGAATEPEAYSSPAARATIASLRQRQQVAL